MYVTEKVAKGVCVFSILALIVMLVITLLDIILRFFFNAPFVGTIEIARMMLVCMAPAFVYALMQKRHIQVPVFVDMLGRKGQLVFDIVGDLLTAGVCAIMSYQGIISTLHRMDLRQVYSALRVPTWPFTLLFAISMGIFSIVVLMCLVDTILDKDKYVKKPKVKNVGDAVNE